MRGNEAMKNSSMILLVVCLAATGFAQETREEWAAAGKCRDAWFERIFDKILPQTVYGKVVDQYGAPISSAEVSIHWEDVTALSGKQSGIHNDHVRTDVSGCWTLTLSKPHSAYVSEVSKEGYECLSKNNYGDTGGNLVERKPAVDHPVVSVMRKRGPVTFLITSPNGNRWTDPLFQTKGTNSVSRPLDLLSWKSDPRWKDCATTNADLRIDAVFDADKKCWNVTYSVTNGPGGIVLSDKMLYEAPADGYSPSVAVTVTNVYGWRRYLYVKSREPAMYSRVLFEHGDSIGTNPSLRVSCKAWVNPYGDRNLEYDDRLANSWRVREALTAESVAAICSRRLPPKPDIAQRIKETDERVAREEAEKDRRHKEWLEQRNKLRPENAE